MRAANNTTECTFISSVQSHGLVLMAKLVVYISIEGVCLLPAVTRIFAQAMLRYIENHTTVLQKPGRHSALLLSC